MIDCTGKCHASSKVTTEITYWNCYVNLPPQLECPATCTEDGVRRNGC